MNTPASAPPRRPVPTAAVLALPAAALLLGGCMPRVDLKRMAYETLRREDCRLNQLESFCQRTFALEYAEYERLRRHYIRDAAEAAAVGTTDAPR